MSTLVLPGFANAHSHAFQRLMRGGTQHRPPGSAPAESTFWSWRDRMYLHANALGLDAIEDVAVLAYAECLEAGYTSVGEFHYLHHEPDGSPYPDPVATSRAHIRAARRLGLRLSLAFCVYATSGFGQPLWPAQRRFAARSPELVAEHLSLLQDESDATIRIDLALHSVRAVPREWMALFAALARARGHKIHVHVSEQRREVELCRASYGLSPIGLLAAEGVLGPDTLLIHATWVDADDMALIARSGATVVLCPTTEGDLGDGIPPIAAMLEHGIPLCIGSDSHAVIDPFAELRHAEYLARVATERRVVFADAEGFCAPALLALGGSNGHHALGFESARDVVTLDLSDRIFDRCEDPMTTALLSGHRGLVDKVIVNGRTVVRGGRICG